MRAQDVGWSTNRIVLGKHSGRAAFADALAKMDITLEYDDFRRAFDRFKELADRKKRVFDSDLEAILTGNQAGIGGPWVKPLTLRWINEVRQAYNGKIFIAGTNGAYDWRDSRWRGRPWREAVIYELHVGTFSDDGDFDGVRAHLDRLSDLGVTAIELMPVADFPNDLDDVEPETDPRILELLDIPGSIEQAQVDHPYIGSNPIHVLQEPERKGIVVTIGKENRVGFTGLQDIIGIIIRDIIAGSVVTLIIRGQQFDR